MNAGPCPSCGAELAADQRYCISCGHRNQNSIAPSYLPGVGPERGEVRRGFPIPVPIATTFAAAALGFGVIMGTALSPNLSGLKAGEYIGGPTVAAVPPDDGADADSAGGKKDKGGGAGSSFDSGSSSGSSFGSGFYGSTGSGYFGSTTGGSTDTGTGGVAPPQPDKPDKPKYKFLNGTVIHTNQVAGSYTISAGSTMSAIHASTLPSIGTKVKVPIRKLANGTYAEAAGRQKTGTAEKATFAGVVTDSREGTAPNPDIYTVSARGASVAVLQEDLSGTIAKPAVGLPVTTSVDIKASVPVTFPAPLPPGTCLPPSPGFPRPAIFPGKQLWQTGTPTVGSAVTSTVIETVAQSTCPAQAVLSSDDIRYGGSDFDLFAVPPVNPTLLLPGEAYMAQVTITGGVVTELTGITSDQGTKGADDTSTGQGNLAKAAARTDARIARVAAKHARR